MRLGKRRGVKPSVCLTVKPPRRPRSSPVVSALVSPEHPKVLLDDGCLQVLIQCAPNCVGQTLPSRQKRSELLGASWRWWGKLMRSRSRLPLFQYAEPITAGVLHAFNVAVAQWPQSCKDEPRASELAHGAKKATYLSAGKKHRALDCPRHVRHGTSIYAPLRGSEALSPRAGGRSHRDWVQVFLPFAYRRARSTADARGLPKVVPREGGRHGRVDTFGFGVLERRGEIFIIMGPTLVGW